MALIILSVIGVTLFWFLIMSLISMSVNWKDYKNYKPTYDAFNNGEVVLKSSGDFGIETFKRRCDELYSRTPEILIFNDANGKPKSIKLFGSPTKLSYIHDQFTVFDLYQSYWFNKIIKAYNTVSKEIWVEPRPTRFYTVRVGDKKEFKFLRG